MFNFMRKSETPEQREYWELQNRYGDPDFTENDRRRLNHLESKLYAEQVQKAGYTNAREYENDAFNDVVFGCFIFLFALGSGIILYYVL